MEPCSQRCSAQGQSPDSLYKPTCHCLAPDLLEPAAGSQEDSFLHLKESSQEGSATATQAPPPPTPTRCAPFLQNGLCHA